MTKKTKTTLIIIGSILTVTILVFGIRGIIKSGEKKDEEKKDANDGDESSNTSSNTGKYNPDPLAKEIKKNIEGINLNTYPETAKKILLLTDEEIKILYNHYNKKYAKDYPTLTQLFENEWSDWNGYYKKVYTRLKKLKLY